jgi:hypothetical protein
MADESKTQAEKAQAADDSTAEADDTGGVGDGDGSASDTDAAVIEPLEIAVAALEALTEAVATLGDAASEEAGPHLVALANELRSAAEQIVQAVDPEAAAAGTGEDISAPDQLDSAISSIRDLLGSVEKMIQPAIEKAKAQTPTAPGAAQASPGWAPQAPAAAASPGVATQTPTAPAAAASGAADSELSKSLTSLAASMANLAGVVKQQNQRVASLEKRFGLPSSSATDEHPRRSSDGEDVGWPLDMNRPMDREHIDKAVSFHDP